MMNIEITNLCFTYPTGLEALKGISLTMDLGEQVAIVGQNGAGKTTLVRHFNGLLKPTSGSVTIGDWETTKQSVAKLASRVGYVFQNPDEQLFSRDVLTEVSFGPRNLGYAKGRVDELVQRGARRGIVTAGERPTLASDGHSHWRITPPPVRALNPIGSGDAFTAALVWRLVRGDDLGEACRWGSAAGAANALTIMAGEVQRAEVERLAGAARVERLV